MELNKETLWQLFKTFSASGKQVENNAEEEKQPSAPTPLIKQNQFTDSLLQVIEVMYCPPEKDDLHGERMSEVEVRKMVDNFNQNIENIQGNLGHIKNTDKFKPVKAWVNEVECMIGDNLVVEGTPLVKIQFNDVDLYEKRKSGQILGLSIGAMGRSVEKD